MISQAKLSSNYTRKDFRPNQASCDFSCQVVNKELQVAWLALESCLLKTVTAYIFPWRGNANIVTQELPELVSLICFLGLLNSSWDLNLQGEKTIPGKSPLEITKSPKAIPGKSPLETTKHQLVHCKKLQAKFTYLKMKCIALHIGFSPRDESTKKMSHIHISQNRLLIICTACQQTRRHQAKTNWRLFLHCLQAENEFHTFKLLKKLKHRIICNVHEHYSFIEAPSWFILLCNWFYVQQDSYYFKKNSWPSSNHIWTFHKESLPLHFTLPLTGTQRHLDSFAFWLNFNFDTIVPISLFSPPLCLFKPKWYI